jgi:hypothetical protein
LNIGLSIMLSSLTLPADIWANNYQPDGTCQLFLLLALFDNRTPYGFLPTWGYHTSEHPPSSTSTGVAGSLSQLFAGFTAIALPGQVSHYRGISHPQRAVLNQHRGQRTRFLSISDSATTPTLIARVSL